jgi:hypothetical protein
MQLLNHTHCGMMKDGNIVSNLASKLSNLLATSFASIQSLFSNAPKTIVVKKSTFRALHIFSKAIKYSTHD